MKKSYALAGIMLSLALVVVFCLGAFLLRQIIMVPAVSAAQPPETEGDAPAESEPEPPDPAEDSDPEPEPEPDGLTMEQQAYLNETIRKVTLLSAQYDYDAALELLRAEEAQTYPELQEMVETLETQKAELLRWEDTTTVPHVFFHSLIVDPSRAFDGDYKQTGYNLYMATTDEFRAILQQMYENGYVLVSIYDVAYAQQQPDGSVKYVQGDILLPPGKKPFVLSQDDTNYYAYMIDGDGDGKADAQGDGFASKLVPTEDGSIACEYVTADGRTLIGDYDLAPILERFLEEHPDFSYRGARAIIGVTGYEGVYGYRTHPKYEQLLGTEAYQKELEQAKALTQRLKELGYLIASHSFGHPAYGEISADAVAVDVRKWEEQVQPITGDTDIFLYPYGSDIAGVDRYCGSKYEALYAAGYRYFCNVDGGHDYWVQIHGDYVRQARRNIDGYRMYHNPGMLDDLFDARSVLDPARPLPVPDI